MKKSHLYYIAGQPRVISLCTFQLLGMNSIEGYFFRVLIKNSDGIQFTDDELYIIIAYMEPDLETFGGKSLLPYRYCIDKDHRCHGVVNHVSRFSLIHSIDTEEGRCIVNSVSLKKVKESDKKVGSFCLNSDDDDDDEEVGKTIILFLARKCPFIGFHCFFSLLLLSRFSFESPL